MAEIQSLIAQHYSKKVIPLVLNARSNIEVLMYEWKWYSHKPSAGVQKLNLALTSAARKGVKIKALLNSESMGHALTRINSNTVSFLQRYGIDAKLGCFGSVVHAKMMIIDDEILILGSHNYTHSAFTRNQEASIIVIGREEIRPYRIYFKGLWDSY